MLRMRPAPAPTGTAACRFEVPDDVAGRVVVVRVIGHLDERGARRLRRMALRPMRYHVPVQLDLAAVSGMDAAAIAELQQLVSAALADHGVRFCAWSGAARAAVEASPDGPFLLAESLQVPLVRR
jgi:anti-anti-sigma regulatory factor